MPEDAVGKEWKAAAGSSSGQKDEFWAFGRLCEIAKANDVVSMSTLTFGLHSRREVPVDRDSRAKLGRVYTMVHKSDLLAHRRAAREAPQAAAYCGGTGCMEPRRGEEPRRR